MKTETQSFYQAAVERAVARVVRSLDSALDLSSLAREAALSPFHFHRVFRGMVGETPLEMHRRLRLERAARQLVSTDDPVTTIAFDAGYETHESFTRVFRRAFGAAPSSFRNDARGDTARPRQLDLTAPCGVHFSSSYEPTSLVFLIGETTMHVDIETMAEQRVATVRHVGPYSRIGDAFARLGELAGRAGLLTPDAATGMVAIYYDDPETTPPDQLTSDAGIVVKEGITLPAGLVERRLSAGQYARTTHEGPYTRLGDTWARLMGDWLPKSGHRVGAGSSFEVYRNTPENAAPAELRTDLYVPITGANS